MKNTGDEDADAEHATVVGKDVDNDGFYDAEMLLMLMLNTTLVSTMLMGTVLGNGHADNGADRDHDGGNRDANNDDNDGVDAQAVVLDCE